MCQLPVCESLVFLGLQQLIQSMIMFVNGCFHSDTLKIKDLALAVYSLIHRMKSSFQLKPSGVDRNLPHRTQVQRSYLKQKYHSIKTTRPKISESILVVLVTYLRNPVQAYFGKKKYKLHGVRNTVLACQPASYTTEFIGDILTTLHTVKCWKAYFCSTARKSLW